MTDNIILICIAIFLPMGLVIANRLLDRTESKKKDDTISQLTSKVAEMAMNSRKADAKVKVADDLVDFAQSAKESESDKSAMMAEAKKVSSLDEAIALAQKQIDRNRK